MAEKNVRIPVVSIIGRSDSGKTTLIERLIPELRSRGVRVGTIKHDVHGFEMDREGKDSYRHKHAGACITVISSPGRIGMVRDVNRDHCVAELVQNYFQDVDLVLTEGYKREGWPKIEVVREGKSAELLSGPEDGLLAVVSDHPLESGVPCFRPWDVSSIVEFLTGRFDLGSPETGTPEKPAGCREDKAVENNKDRIVQCVKRYAEEDRLTCAGVFRIAKETDTPPLEVGKIVDELGIRFTRCQLGLFGYGASKKGIEPAEEIRPDLEKAIRASMEGGRLPCKAAWRIASELGVKKTEVSSLCDRLGIKIGPCQIGAF